MKASHLKSKNITYKAEDARSLPKRPPIPNLASKRKRQLMNLQNADLLNHDLYGQGVKPINNNMSRT